jgi:hypothetical protein
MVNDLGLSGDKTITRDKIIQWFNEHHPEVIKGTLYCQITLHSTNAPSRIHYNPKPKHDILFQLNRDLFRRFSAQSDPKPIYDREVIPPPSLPVVETVESGGSEFAYEKDLRQYLAKNISIIEGGLKVYADDESGTTTGIEFPAGDKSIDILAVDKNSDFVVIELKVSKGYDRVVGQLLYYMGWIKQNLAEEKHSVRGIIVAREISEDLKLAALMLQNVKLIEYELKVTLKPVNK